MRKLLLIAVAVLFGTAVAQEAPKAPAKKADAPKLTAKWLDPLKWRSIGPANMGGRITSITVYEKDQSVWWVATASGGLLKTINNGTTFEHQFHLEATVSIGDVAVAQTDPNIVWVGTGECNPRNSVSWGDGVYKSTDSGKTWKNMGLKKSFQIGAVRIHPTNKDIVYVGALGRLWGTGGDRGLYKTTDGGKNWKRIHFVDDKTGVIDIQMHPNDPDTLLIATYERQRDGFDTNSPSKKFAPGTGLYKTTDGGQSFRKITAGLPSCKLGRIGLQYYAKNPDLVYMVLESEKIGKEPENAPYIGITGTDAEVGAKLLSIIKKGPAEKAGLKEDDIVLGVNEKRVHSYNDFLRAVRQHVAGDKIKIEVSRERKTVNIDLTLGSRPKPKQPKQAEPKQAKAPQGQPAQRQQRRPPQRRSPFSAFLGGQRANFQDQQGKQGHEYGGIYKSTDGGDSWTRINSVNPRPMYFSEIRIDPVDNNWLWVLGVRLWKSNDAGAKFTSDGHGRGVHVDHHAMWIDPKDGRHMILGNDGGIYVTNDRGKNWDHLNHVAIGQFYHVGVGPRRDYRVYGGLQDNGSWGGPSIVRHARGPTNADWMRVGGGDGFVCRVDPKDPDLIYFESQNGAVGRRHLRTAERAGMRPRAPRGTRYRWNWNTPFILSHHNTKIYYTAANRVFRSLDRGVALRAISKDITHTDRGSATTLSESPRDPNLLYVGTDDGALWMTRNGGHTWTDLYTFQSEDKPKAKEKPQPATSVTSEHKHGNGNGDEKQEGDEKKKPAEKKAAEKEKPEEGKEENPRVKAMIDRLLSMDQNGDGVLQKDEVPVRAQGMFDRLDANKDGVISAEEIRAAAERRAARRGGGRRRPGADTPEPATADAKKTGKAKQAPKVKGSTIADLVSDRRWVNHIETSRFKTGRAYVVFDGHRQDDDRPHIYVTEDFGQTWKSLRANLPDNAGTTRVLREDLKNEKLLYLGTEFAAFVSIDRGESWVSLKTNLPTVAVHAFALHAGADEVVAATHGRSLWVLDTNVLRQVNPEVLASNVHLFKPKAAIIWRPALGRGGSRTFTGSNPPAGATLYYHLAKKTEGVMLKITTPDGTLVRNLTATGEAGLNRVVWNLRRERPQGRRGRFRRFGPRVQPGTYRAELTIGGESQTTRFEVRIDPQHPDERWIPHANREEEMEAARAEAKSAKRYPWLHDSGDD